MRWWHVFRGHRVRAYVDALTFKVLHASQTGHDATITEAS